MSKERVTDAMGKTIGWLEDDGSKIWASVFTGKRIGFYDKKRGCTCDFYGRKVCSGDGTIGLIMKEQ